MTLINFLVVFFFQSFFLFLDFFFPQVLLTELLGDALPEMNTIKFFAVLLGQQKAGL